LDLPGGPVVAADDDDLGEITPPPAATTGPPGKSKQPKAKGRDKDDEGDD